MLYSPDSGRLNMGELITRPTVRAVASRVPVASVRSQWQLPASRAGFRPEVVFVPYHLTTPLLHGRIPVVSVIQDCIFERNTATNGRSVFSLHTGPSPASYSLRCDAAGAFQGDRARHRRFYGVKLPHEAIVPYGVGAQFFSVTGRYASSRADLPERYILHVGARRPHKNQRVLVEALAAVAGQASRARPRPSRPARPSVSGRCGRANETLGLSDYVCQYTQANDEVLRDLYANADVFAFPSLIEGFGMPRPRSDGGRTSGGIKRYGCGSGGCWRRRSDRPGPVDRPMGRKP